jgi:hypothetical protein
LDQDGYISNISKAQSGVADAIANSYAPDLVKVDLAGKAASVFRESFPYAGVGSILPNESSIDGLLEDIAETPRIAPVEPADDKNALEAEADAFAALARAQFINEKKQGSRTSSVKGSDAG